MAMLNIYAKNAIRRVERASGYWEIRDRVLGNQGIRDKNISDIPIT
jgi:hypothetical protein